MQSWLELEHSSRIDMACRGRLQPARRSEELRKADPVSESLTCVSNEQEVLYARCCSISIAFGYQRHSAR